MKRKCRIWSLAQTLAIILTVIPLFSLQAEAADNEGWLWPVPAQHSISSVMEQNRDGDPHRGIDIPQYGKSTLKTESSMKVVATKSGTVITAHTKDDNARGVYIVLRHEGNKFSLYQHLKLGSMTHANDSQCPKHTNGAAGAKIEQACVLQQGEKVGTMGNTGKVGTHLHFEAGSIDKNNTRTVQNVNPDDFSMKTLALTPAYGTTLKNQQEKLKIEWLGKRMSYIFEPSSPGKDTTGDPDTSVKPGTYVAVSGKSPANTHVFNMPQSTSPSKKLAELVPGTIVTIVSGHTSPSGNAWGKVANRNSYVAMDRLVAYKAPSWTPLPADKQAYVTNDKNIKIYTDPSSYSAEVRTISAANTAVKVIATTKNAAGNTWGKIKDGECIYMGSLKEAASTPTPAPASALPTPTVSVNGSSVKISWAAVKNASNVYLVLMQPDNPNFVSYGGVNSVTSYTYDNLSDGNYYAFLSATVNSKSVSSEYVYFTVNVSRPTPIAPTATATIVYNANGGTDAPSSHSAAIDSQGDVYFILSTTIPTRSGYTFLGWRLENRSNEVITYPGQGISLWLVFNDRSETLTYYAQWETIAVSEIDFIAMTPSIYYVKKDRDKVSVYNTPLRNGPNWYTVRSLSTNAAVTVVGRTSDGQYYKLDDGNWVGSDNLTKTKP